MQAAEFDALLRVEQEHWFYRGKRALTLHWIERLSPRRELRTIVDIGAGTGALVRELHAAFGGTRVRGIEHAEVARELARAQLGVPLEDGSVLALPVQTSESDITIALDVLEHVTPDTVAFGELVRITRPGGLILINVPAFMALWSSWDVALGHHRRYTRKSFLALLRQHEADVEIISLKYINELLFLPIWLYRVIARVLRLRSRAEDVVPPRFINALLFRLLLWPATQTWLRPPFGVSLYAVLRRKAVS